LKYNIISSITITEDLTEQKLSLSAMKDTIGILGTLE